MKTKLRPTEQKNEYTTRLFVKAITYRIPLPVTKAIVYADDTAYPLCPRCEMALEREYMSFCDRCGQKLNWDLFEHARIVHPGSKRK